LKERKGRCSLPERKREKSFFAEAERDLLVNWKKRPSEKRKKSARNRNGPKKEKAPPPVVVGKKGKEKSQSSTLSAT